MDKIPKIVGTVLDVVVRSANKALAEIERMLPEVNLTTNGKRYWFVRILGWCIQGGSTEQLTIHNALGTSFYEATTVTFAPAYSVKPQTFATVRDVNSAGGTGHFITAIVGSDPATEKTVVTLQAQIPVGGAGTETCYLNWWAAGKL